MHNLSLHYSGGSGGFIGLHVLLETNRYFCSLEGLSFLTDSNFLDNFNYLKSQHWNIPDISLWKHTEIWPDNLKTENSTTTRAKIFFYCNYFESNKNSKTVLVYTDIESQHKLAKHKNANWYQGLPIIDRPLRWQEIYHHIKTDEWDNSIDLLSDFNSLPKYQQDEISACQLINSRKNLSTQIESPKYVDSLQILNDYETLDNGIKVKPSVAEFYKKADYCVRLQDLINTSGKALLEPLGLPHTENHTTLINHWKKLHSSELLEAIGIDSSIRA